MSAKFHFLQEVRSQQPSGGCIWIPWRMKVHSASRPRWAVTVQWLWLMCSLVMSGSAQDRATCSLSQHRFVLPISRMCLPFSERSCWQHDLPLSTYLNGLKLLLCDICHGRFKSVHVVALPSDVQCIRRAGQCSPVPKDSFHGLGAPC